MCGTWSQLGYPLVVGLMLVARPATAQTPAILGYWEGSSICIKEAWNTACHDEHTRYHVFPADSGGVILDAYKLAGGAWESMGKQPLAYDSAAGRWTGEFANARFHIEWSFQVAGDSLTRRLVVLPDRRLARRVRATRAPADTGRPITP